MVKLRILSQSRAGQSGECVTDCLETGQAPGCVQAGEDSNADSQRRRVNSKQPSFICWLVKQYKLLWEII